MRPRSAVFAAVLLEVLAGPVSPAYALGGGLVTTNVATASDRAAAVAVQPDGKIVAAGTEGRQFALVRYNPNGSLDAGFGTAGIVKTTFETAHGDPLYFGNALAVRDDGRIIVVGTGGSASLIAARYNPDGSLDAGFGVGGKVVTAFPNTTLSHGNAMVLRAGGRIVAAGSAIPDFGVARYNPNGTLDPTFGQGGLVTTDFAGGLDLGRAVVSRPDGRVVVAGVASTLGREDIELAGYRADGFA